MRWKCSKCYDYDLCTACYNAGKHSLEHEFSRYDVLDNFRYVVCIIGIVEGIYMYMCN